jgi:hypothetical protein
MLLLFFLILTWHLVICHGRSRRWSHNRRGSSCQRYDIFEEIQALPILIEQVTSLQPPAGAQSQHHWGVLKGLIFIFGVLVPMKLINYVPMKTGDLEFK